ncbi:MAG: HDOD domain-containing protein, partial [Desulfohalobiaceae bacterium]
MKQIEELPSIPSVALKALDMCMDEEVDISRLAKVIESDQGLTVKVLKLVNSVQNALRQPVSSVGQAINLLGLNMVRSAILGVLITDFLPRSDEEQDSPAQKLWSHGLACSVAAQLVAVRTYPELKNEAFVAGMLHDLGKGAIIHFMPEQYARVAEHQHKHQVEAMVAEQEILDTNHAQVGKWLAERWDLPKSLRDVIWLHHQPIDAIKELDVNQELLNIVILADLLAKEFFCDLSDPAGSRLMLGKLQKILALSDDELDSIRSQLGEQYAERANIFSLNGDLKAIYFQSLQKSNQRLSLMAVNLEIKNATLKRSNQVLDLNNGLALSLAGAR